MDKNTELLQEEYLSTDYVMGFELEGYVPAVEDRVYSYKDHPSTLAIEKDMIDIFGKTSEFPKLVDDSSLSSTDSEKTGFELASTPIPVSPSNLSKIKKYLSHIQDAYGFYVDDRCGFHTHVTWPGVNPAEMAWILMQLSVDESAREILKSVNDQIYFYNERYANDDELKQIISLMQRGYSNVEEFVKKIEFFIGDKWSGFHAHSSNTLEWRAPRGFIGTVDGISLYLKKFVYFLQKLSKYLSNDEFVMPSGLKVTKRGVQEVFDKIAAGSGDHSLRPSLPGRKWRTDREREEEFEKKVSDKVEIFKEKGLSKLDIYKRFNKLADKFPVTRRFLQDSVGEIDTEGLSLEDFLGVLNFVNKEAVAMNLSTPPEVLIKLAGDESVNVRYRVALNRSIPPEAIIRLSGDGNGDVRKAVAMNSSTPPEVLMKLADDEEVVVRQMVAKNPSTPPDVLMKLASDEKWYVRAEVADNPSAPPEAFIKLSDNIEMGVRNRVAKNPSAPPKALIKLAGDESSDVRGKVAENPSAPPEVLMKLSGDESIYVRSGVTINPSAPSEVLMKLSGDKDVRYGVAINPSAPSEALMRLAGGENFSERAGVAGNPSSPLEVLMKLSDDENVNVRYKVAENLNTPPEVLMKLASDENVSVRELVARNPSAPLEVLMKLSDDENRHVRYAVADNPSAPLEVLMKLSDDENRGVRGRVAFNPNIPLEVLMKLASDEDWRVREAAEINLKTINNSPINESQLLQEEYLSSEFRFGFELEGFCPPSSGVGSGIDFDYIADRALYEQEKERFKIDFYKNEGLFDVYSFVKQLRVEEEVYGDYATELFDKESHVEVFLYRDSKDDNYMTISGDDSGEGVPEITEGMFGFHDTYCDGFEYVDVFDERVEIGKIYKGLVLESCNDEKYDVFPILHKEEVVFVCSEVRDSLNGSEFDLDDEVVRKFAMNHVYDTEEFNDLVEEWFNEFLMEEDNIDLAREIFSSTSSAESLRDNDNVRGVYQTVEKYYEFSEDEDVQIDLKSDGSLYPDDDDDTPFEIASPVIAFTPRNVSNMIKMFDEIQESYGFYVNNSCGFHTHISWPRISPVDAFWVVCNLSLDEKAKKVVKGHNDSLSFIDVEYAKPVILKWLKKVLEGSGSVEEFEKKLFDIPIMSKFNLFGLHPQNTLEWRGPRDFINLDSLDDAKTYVKILFYLVQKIRKYLSSDRLPTGMGKDEFYKGMETYLAKKSGFDDIRPNIKGRQWRSGSLERQRKKLEFTKDPELIQKAYKKEMHQELARNGNIPREMLESYLNGEMGGAPKRTALSSNPALTRDDFLAAIEDYGAIVAQNPSFPPDMYFYLSNRSDFATKFLLLNKNVPYEFVMAMLDYGTPYIRELAEDVYDKRFKKKVARQKKALNEQLLSEERLSTEYVMGFELEGFVPKGEESERMDYSEFYDEWYETILDENSNEIWSLIYDNYGTEMAEGAIREHMDELVGARVEALLEEYEDGNYREYYYLVNSEDEEVRVITDTTGYYTQGELFENVVLSPNKAKVLHISEEFIHTSVEKTPMQFVDLDNFGDDYSGGDVELTGGKKFVLVSQFEWDFLNEELKGIDYTTLYSMLEDLTGCSYLFDDVQASYDEIGNEHESEFFDDIMEEKYREYVNNYENEAEPIPYDEHSGVESIVDDMIEEFGQTEEFPNLTDDVSLEPSDPSDTSFEVGSTPIPVNPRNFSRIVKYIEGIKEDYGFYVNDSCGFHTHVTWPGINPAEVTWILMQLSMDENALSVFRGVDGQVSFYSDKFANYNEISRIYEVLKDAQDGQSPLEVVRGVHKVIKAKFSAFRAHPGNTLEWRAPRGFVGTTEGVIKYLKRFFYFIQKLSEYLGKDSIDLPNGGTLRKVDVQRHYDEAAVEKGRSFRPSLPGREWKTDREREEEFEKKVLDKVEIFKEKGLSKLDIYKRFNKMAEKFPKIKSILRKVVGSLYVSDFSSEDLLGVLNLVNKEATAERPSTPSEVLMKLAGDGSGSVREAVARNKSTPPETLIKLADDKYWYVREAVAKNPNTPSEVLAKLAGDESESVRERVANNPSVPPEVLIKLANDENWSVRNGVAKNPSSPSEVLIKLAGDEDWRARYGVAMNPNTPSEVLAKLADDENENVNVREAARRLLI